MVVAIAEIEAMAEILAKRCRSLDARQAWRAPALAFAHTITNACPRLPSKLRQREAVRAEFDDALADLDRAHDVERRRWWHERP